MSLQESALEKAFIQFADEIGCRLEKTDERFEKYFTIFGQTVNIRVYWHFERAPTVFVTLVQSRDGNDRSIEVSLYLLVCYTTGLEDGPDHRLAGSENPSNLVEIIRKYGLPYLTSEVTDIQALDDWAGKRLLEQNPDFAKLKSNFRMRCEWI